MPFFSGHGVDILHGVENRTYLHRTKHSDSLLLRYVRHAFQLQRTLANRGYIQRFFAEFLGRLKACFHHYVMVVAEPCCRFRSAVYVRFISVAVAV